MSYYDKKSNCIPVKRIEQMSIPIEDTEENKRKKEENKKDTQERKAIRDKIIELLDFGFPKEEILVRLEKEFPNSSFSGFFESWIEHYSKSQNNNRNAKRPYNFRGEGR